MLGGMGQSLYPSFRYRDADGAIRWMQDVLGGELLQRMAGGGDGVDVAHAEVEIAGGVLVVAGVRIVQRTRVRSAAVTAVAEPDRTPVAVPVRT